MSNEQFEARSRMRVARFVPQRYQDLDAEKKPLIGSLVILGGVIPLFVLAWHFARQAHGYQNDLNAMLAHGGATLS